MGTYRVGVLLQTSPTGLTNYLDGSGSHLFPPTDAITKTIINLFPGNVPPVGQFISSNNPANALLAGSLLMIPDPQNIFLDGAGGSVPESGLPVGFNVTSAQYFSLEHGDVGVTLSHFVGATQSVTVPITYDPSFVNLNDVLSTKFGATWSSVTMGTSMQFALQEITGNYSLIRGTSLWTFQDLTNTSLPANNFVPGDTILITDPNIVPATDLTKINLVKLGGIPATIISATPSTLLIQLPRLPAFPPPPPFVSPYPITIYGTQFSGSVLLGFLTPIITDGSGVYSITPGKTHDTIYVNTPTGNTTVDLAIPNPFFRTGFIGG